MKARKYTKVVEVWQVTKVSDGFGGYTTSEEQITSSWANITTPNSKIAKRLNDMGITEQTDVIMVNFRKRNDITYSDLNKFLKYKGNKYIIQSVTDVDLDITEVEIIATKEKSKTITVDTPI